MDFYCDDAMHPRARRRAALGVVQRLRGRAGLLVPGAPNAMYKCASALDVGASGLDSDDPQFGGLHGRRLAGPVWPAPGPRRSGARACIMSGAAPYPSRAFRISSSSSPPNASTFRPPMPCTSSSSRSVLGLRLASSTRVLSVKTT